MLNFVLYALGIIVAGLLVYFVIGWLTSIFTIVVLTVAIYFVVSFIRKRKRS